MQKHDGLLKELYFSPFWQVNGLVAGAVAGGAIAAMTRSWTQVIPMACLVSAFKVATDYARAI